MIKLFDLADGHALAGGRRRARPRRGLFEHRHVRYDELDDLRGQADK